MKKSNISPTPTADKPDNTLLILFTAIIIFGVVVLVYVTFLTTSYTTTTEIVKIKYTSSGSLGITTDCGHPIRYKRSLSNSQINLSDVYEVTINTSIFGEEITSFKLTEKERYIKNCN